MNYMDIKFPDSANGTGIRVSLFVSGCPHRCKGCFNADSWDFRAGKPFGEAEKALIFSHLAKPYISGLSLLGGEPMYPENARELSKLVAEVKHQFPDKDVWLWTGYRYEELNTSEQLVLLSQVDYIVDGRFEEEKKQVGLKFRGSSNQRIIDVAASILYGEPVGVE